jgi:coatomer subunit delta
MIIGAFITNIRTNQITSRLNDPLSITKIEHLLLDFLNSVSKKEGILEKSLYKYIYTFSNDNYYVLITSLLFKEIKGKKLLNFLVSNSTHDPVDQLVTIDNILYGDNILYPNLSLIKNMESQEEKIYKMMMKNKETEMKKKQKDLKYTKPLIKESSGIKVESVTNIPSQEKKITEKRKRFETSQNGVFVLLKERLRCEIDIENNLKTLEINGEMNINIKNEKYKNIEIKLSGDILKCKFSPKLDKGSSVNGLIRSNKDFSLNKNIALMKWKDTELRNLPISFTFWPSEVKLGTYQISLEFVADEDLEDLVINIPKKNMLDVLVEGAKETGNIIEWSIGTVKKGESDTLDFQCKCNDVNDIFPIEVFFTADEIYLDVQVEEVRVDGGKVKEDCEIKKILEVENFKINYE